MRLVRSVGEVSVGLLAKRLPARVRVWLLNEVRPVGSSPWCGSREERAHRSEVGVPTAVPIHRVTTEVLDARDHRYRPAQGVPHRGRRRSIARYELAQLTGAQRRANQIATVAGVGGAVPVADVGDRRSRRARLPAGAAARRRRRRRRRCARHVGGPDPGVGSAAGRTRTTRTTPCRSRSPRCATPVCARFARSATTRCCACWRSATPTSVDQRTRLVCRLHALLVELAPGGIAKEINASDVDRVPRHGRPGRPGRADPLRPRRRAARRHPPPRRTTQGVAPTIRPPCRRRARAVTDLFGSARSSPPC